MSSARRIICLAPVEPLKATLYDYFGISICFVYSIFINTNKFAYDKFKTAKFGFSIFDVFSEVFVKIVYFLDKHHKYRVIQHLSVVLLFPYYYDPDKHAHT